MLDEATGVPPKQRQLRLRTHELEQLTADYRSGVAINELAARYEIDRHTVIHHMRRQSVPRRNPRLNEAGVLEAVRLYQSGESLATIGQRMDVDPGTVGRSLRRAACRCGIVTAGSDNLDRHSRLATSDFSAHTSGVV
jgi:predicted DNA-binding protein (UPF0251 family)